MGFAITRHRPNAPTAPIGLPHLGGFGSSCPSQAFRRFLQITSWTPCGTRSQFGGLAFCAYASLILLGVLLPALTGFPAMAQQNAKNILVVFSGVDRTHDEDLALIASSVRAGAPGQDNFYVAY